MNPHINTGGPAFPLGTSEHVDGVHYAEAGMTLRDYFAAKAMSGLILNEADTDFSEIDVDKGLANLSYRIADAMLAAREVKA
ncbi:MAG: hypothetical protein KGL35_13630 [Bradyrhizobium sp.]|nr:hypothetical protein [Bradyrhizobium sp.]